MAKKKSWLSKLKKLFITEKQSKTDKESKKRWLLKRLKNNKLASLAPPPVPPAPSLPVSPTKNHVENQQRKHDFTVAIAAAVAAEAAAISAHAAAEVARITNMPQIIIHESKNRAREFPDVIQLHDLPQHEKSIQESAAIKIQTAFRGYLARIALRALKGLGKLQAIIRGRAVRRQAITTLKCLQSMVSIQSQVCARRSQTFEEICHCDDNNPWHGLKDKASKNMQESNNKRWDDSILTKEEANAMFLSKKEAFLKRGRIKEYALINRKSADHEDDRSNGKLKFWLEQWVDTQLAKREDLEDINSILSSTPRAKQQNHKNHYRIDGLVSPISIPRKSFNQKRNLSRDDDPSTVPTYMAATESAKAKAKPMNSPKKLSQMSFDTFSQGNSPFKNKLSVLSSVMVNEGLHHHHRSPSLKGVPGPVKSGTRKEKKLSFDSESSLLNWDRFNSFR